MCPTTSSSAAASLKPLFPSGEFIIYTRFCEIVTDTQQDAVRPQSLRHPDRPAPLHRRPLRRLLLQRALQVLDPVPSMGVVGLALRRHRFHALDVLEEKELSNESRLLGRFHRAGGVQHQRYHELLRKQDRPPGSDLHARHLLGPYTFRVPDEIRLHELVALPLRRALGPHPLRLHGHVLPANLRS